MRVAAFLADRLRGHTGRSNGDRIPVGVEGGESPFP